MKKMISVLFALQLFIFSFYGLFYLRSSNFYDLMLSDRWPILLNFNHEIEDYDYFLTVTEEQGLIVSRVVHPDEETAIIYTTDVTLEGTVTLISGTFPEAQALHSSSALSRQEKPIK